MTFYVTDCNYFNLYLASCKIDFFESKSRIIKNMACVCIQTSVLNFGA